MTNLEYRKDAGIRGNSRLKGAKKSCGEFLDAKNEKSSWTSRFLPQAAPFEQAGKAEQHYTK